MRATPTLLSELARSLAFESHGLKSVAKGLGPPFHAPATLVRNFSSLSWRGSARLEALPMRSMPSRELTISNKLGIHARPAAQFVRTASQFSAEIRVEKDGEEVDGKSIMGLMMLAAGHGSVLNVIAEGEDAEDALKALEDLVGRNFEEV